MAMVRTAATATATATATPTTTATPISRTTTTAAVSVSATSKVAANARERPCLGRVAAGEPAASGSRYCCVGKKGWEGRGQGVSDSS